MNAPKEDGRASRARAIHSGVHDRVIAAMRRLIIDGDLPTSSELAKEAGVSTTTIYNHFPESIPGILLELMQRIDRAAAEAATARQPQGGREMVRAALTTYAVELTKLGRGGRFILKERFDLNQPSSPDDIRPFFENRVAAWLTADGYANDETLWATCRRCGVLWRGAGTSWILSDESTRRHDDAYAVSDSEFIELSRDCIDAAIAMTGLTRPS